jgi:hypothetical protein
MIARETIVAIWQWSLCRTQIKWKVQSAEKNLPFSHILPHNLYFVCGQSSPAWAGNLLKYGLH